LESALPSAVSDQTDPAAINARPNLRVCGLRHA
jgi:hypothetical protein